MKKIRRFLDSGFVKNMWWTRLKNLNTGEAGSKENTTRVHDNTASVEAGVVASWHKKVTKKNFGNLDCGAKVAAANQEAQNALHLITPSK